LLDPAIQAPVPAHWQVSSALFPFDNRYVPEVEWHKFIDRLHCLYTLILERAATMSELVREGISTAAIADAVTQETGDLLLVASQRRRSLELDAFDEIFCGSTLTV
jgi:hypothetical protein